jgi:hypothetical protein
LLRASFDLTIPRWRLVVLGCLWFQRNGHEWIAFPSKEWTDRDGAKKYSNFLEFTDRETAGRFRGAALAALYAIAERSR